MYWKLNDEEMERIVSDSETRRRAADASFCACLDVYSDSSDEGRLERFCEAAAYAVFSLPDASYDVTLLKRIFSTAANGVEALSEVPVGKIAERFPPEPDADGRGSDFEKRFLSGFEPDETFGDAVEQYLFVSTNPFIRRFFAAREAVAEGIRNASPKPNRSDAG